MRHRFSRLLISLLLSTTALADPLPIYDLSGGFLLGTTNPWQPAIDAAPDIPAQPYRIVALSGIIGQASGSAPQRLDPPPEDIFEINFQPQPEIAEDTDYFAVGGSHPLLPRPLRPAALDQPAYREAAGAALTELGLPGQTPTLTQLFRVDLDGDGSDEVLLSTTRYRHAISARVPSPQVAAGDYSLVLLRRVVDGQVQTQVLGSAVYPQAQDYSAPLQYSVAAVLDLDGDGVMEVIVRDIYYEGTGAIVYRWSAQGMQEVLSGGWGF